MSQKELKNVAKSLTFRAPAKKLKRPQLPSSKARVITEVKWKSKQVEGIVDKTLQHELSEKVLSPSYAIQGCGRIKWVLKDSGVVSPGRIVLKKIKNNSPGKTSQMKSVVRNQIVESAAAVSTLISLEKKSLATSEKFFKDPQWVRQKKVGVQNSVSPKTKKSCSVAAIPQNEIAAQREIINPDLEDVSISSTHSKFSNKRMSGKNQEENSFVKLKVKVDVKDSEPESQNTKGKSETITAVLNSKSVKSEMKTSPGDVIATDTLVEEKSKARTPKCSSQGKNQPKVTKTKKVISVRDVEENGKAHSLPKKIISEDSKIEDGKDRIDFALSGGNVTKPAKDKAIQFCTPKVKKGKSKEKDTTSVKKVRVRGLKRRRVESLKVARIPKKQRSNNKGIKLLVKEKISKKRRASSKLLAQQRKRQKRSNSKASSKCVTKKVPRKSGKKILAKPSVAGESKENLKLASKSGSKVKAKRVSVKLKPTSKSDIKSPSAKPATNLESKNEAKVQKRNDKQSLASCTVKAQKRTPVKRTRVKRSFVKRTPKASKKKTLREVDKNASKSGCSLQKTQRSVESGPKKPNEPKKKIAEKDEKSAESTLESSELSSESSSSVSASLESSSESESSSKFSESLDSDSSDLESSDYESSEYESSAELRNKKKVANKFVKKRKTSKKAGKSGGSKALKPKLVTAVKKKTVKKQTKQMKKDESRPKTETKNINEPKVSSEFSESRYVSEKGQELIILKVGKLAKNKKEGQNKCAGAAKQAETARMETKRESPSRPKTFSGAKDKKIKKVKASRETEIKGCKALKIPVEPNASMLKPEKAEDSSSAVFDDRKAINISKVDKMESIDQDRKNVETKTSSHVSNTLESCSISSSKFDVEADVSKKIQKKRRDIGVAKLVQSRAKKSRKEIVNSSLTTSRSTTSDSISTSTTESTSTSVSTSTSGSTSTSESTSSSGSDADIPLRQQKTTLSRNNVFTKPEKLAPKSGTSESSSVTYDTSRSSSSSSRESENVLSTVSSSDSDDEHDLSSESSTDEDIPILQLKNKVTIAKRKVMKFGNAISRSTKSPKRSGGEIKEGLPQSFESDKKATPDPKKKKFIHRRRIRKRRVKGKKARTRRRRIPQSKEKISITAYQRKNLDFVYSYALKNGFTESNWKNVAKSIRRIKAVKVQEAIEKRMGRRLSSGLNLVRMKFFNLPRVCLKKADKRKIEREINKKLKTIRKRGGRKFSQQESSSLPTRQLSASLSNKESRSMSLPPVAGQNSDTCFTLDLSDDDKSTSTNSSLTMADLNEEAQNQVLDKFLTLFGA